MIWITSDPHFGHKNIAGPEVSEWSKGYRNFKDQYEMTDCIINTFNKYVKPEDTLYNLGDWSFGGKNNIAKFRKRLAVGTIHTLIGNHDHHIEKNTYLDEHLAWSQDLFTSVQHVLWTKLEGRDFFMSHYAHRVWPGSHKGVIHLYAHSHDTIPDYGKSMDVGVDVAYRMFGEYRPFSLDEIIKIMNKKKEEFPDHHSLTTNSR